MRRYALVLCIALSAGFQTGYSQSVTAESFLGDWHAIGTPDDLTRVLIERKGANFNVRIWSQCLPAECDWGEATATVASGGSALTAKFNRSYAEYSEEFALLTDGSLEVTTRIKGGVQDTYVSFLTKKESGYAGLHLPVYSSDGRILKPPAEPPGAGLSGAIDRHSPHCTFVVEPAAIAFEVAGGDAQVAVHAPLGCPWTSASDAVWLNLTAGPSGAGEGEVVLHASANSGRPRNGTVTIAGVSLAATQNGAGRTWEIPLLFFGPNYWSVLRVTNPSMRSRQVMIDIYPPSGNRVPIQPVFDVRPRETLEILIERREVEVYRRSSQRPGDLNGPRTLDTILGGTLPAEGSSWVRITQTHEDSLPDLNVRALLEVLNGDKISDFPRDPREPVELRGWTIQAKEVRGQQIYFLNVSDQTTTVTFCVSNKARTEPCEKKDSSPTRIRVKPNQFIVFDVKKFPQRFFFVESSNPGLAIVAKLALAKGTTRQFSSESSISFGDPSR